MKVIAIVFAKPVRDLAHLAEIFYHVTPQLAKRGEQMLFLEIDACRKLYHEEALIRRVRKIFSQLELPVRLGVGATPALAICQALHGTSCLTRLPLTALNYFYDPFGNEPALQEPLQQMVAQLQKLGIRNLSEARKLSGADLEARFGLLGSQLPQRLSGPSGGAWPRLVLAPEVEESIELVAEQVCDSSLPLLFLLRPLLERLILRLQARGEALKGLELQLKQETNSRLTQPLYSVKMELTLVQPSAKTLLNLVREKLEAQLRITPLKSPLVGLRLKVLQTVPYRTVQKNLFNPKREVQQESYAQLINRLHARLGSDKAFCAAPLASYLPESNWQAQRATELDGPQLPTPELPVAVLPPRPLRLLAPARKLHEVGERWLIGGERLPAKPQSSPEIIYSEWWADHQERRYYQVASPQGRRYWVYQTRDGFFLHGVFD